MRFLTIFLLLVGMAMGQNGQINHPNASQLNYSQNSTPSGWNVAPQWIPGPFVVALGSGGGNLVTFTQGLQGAYFETFVSSGPPMVGANAFVLANGDIVHLDLGSLWFGITPAYNGVTPCNQTTCPSSWPNGPWGALATSFPYNANSIFDFTVQSWVVDPSRASGFRLTAAIHVVR